MDVKLAQANYLIKCVLDFQNKLENNLNVKIPVIICGDFNSTPGDKVERDTVCIVWIVMVTHTHLIRMHVC